MKIHYCVLIFFMVIFLGMIGCDKLTDENADNNNPVNPEASTQWALVWAEIDNNGSIHTEISGVISATILPIFEYYKIGSQTFYDHTYNMGYIDFGYGTEINGSPDPLTIEVKTSLGKMNGSISPPSRNNTVTVSSGDTLQIGKSLTISWSGSNADFYYLSGEYSWVDAQNDWHYQDLDTMVTGNSVTFPGSIFIDDGVIYFYDLEPTNGPYPKKNAQVNMTGEGSGFLYYSNDLDEFEADIIVGHGIWGMSKTTSSNHVTQKRKIERLRHLMDAYIN